MKFTAVAVAIVCAASVQAQYFSEGWQPGQAVTQQPVAPPSYTPGVEAAPPDDTPDVQSAPSSKSLLDWTRLLDNAPVKSIFNKAGINITETLVRARTTPQLWDERVPLITDDNYEEMIVNEPLTPEEEAHRAWFIIITVTAGQTSSISKRVDEQFDAAYNTTLIENDLPYVKWGRIDYLNVTYLTTKWAVWSGPYIVVITDRGQSLRFYRANQVRLRPELIREFLQNEEWRQSEPWQSIFAPGGNGEPVLHYIALALRVVYDWLVILPNWVLMLLSGGFASIVMRFIHREGTPQVKASSTSEAVKEKSPPVPVNTVAPNGSSSATVSPTKQGKKRRGGKK